MPAPRQSRDEHPDKPGAALPRNARVLGWASLLNDVASEIIFPLMPQFLLSVLGGNKLQLGAIEGLADSTASLLKLGAGGWSDILGRRKVFVVVGYALAAVSRPLTGAIWSPWQLLACRGADRVGKGIRTAPRDALIVESTPPTVLGRAFGFQRAMDHLGAAIGPILATLFLLVWPGQLRVLFLLTLFPGLFVVGLVVLGLEESREQAESLSENQKTPSPCPLPRSGGEGIRVGSRSSGAWTWTLAPFSGSFRWYLLSLVLFTLGNSSDAFLLVRAGELGVPTALLPILWFAFHTIKSAGNLVVGRIVDHWGPRRPLLFGWVCYAAVYLAFALATSAWHVWCLFSAYAAFYALTEPAEKTLVARLAGQERKGLAFGWYSMAIGTTAFPSSLMFGGLYEYFGPVAAFGCGAALAMVAAVIVLAAVHEEHVPQHG